MNRRPSEAQGNMDFGPPQPPFPQRKTSGNGYYPGFNPNAPAQPPIAAVPTGAPAYGRSERRPFVSFDGSIPSASPFADLSVDSKFHSYDSMDYVNSRDERQGSGRQGSGRDGSQRFQQDMRDRDTRQRADSLGRSGFYGNNTSHSNSGFFEHGQYNQQMMAESLRMPRSDVGPYGLQNSFQSNGGNDSSQQNYFQGHQPRTEEFGDFGADGKFSAHKNQFVGQQRSGMPPSGVGRNGNNQTVNNTSRFNVGGMPTSITSNGLAGLSGQLSARGMPTNVRKGSAGSAGMVGTGLHESPRVSDVSASPTPSTGSGRNSKFSVISSPVSTYDGEATGSLSGLSQPSLRLSSFRRSTEESDTLPSPIFQNVMGQAPVNVYGAFWNLCYNMIRSAADIRSSHSATIRVAEEMSNLMKSTPNQSPALAVAYDTLAAQCCDDIIGKIPKDNTVKTPMASVQMKMMNTSLSDIMHCIEENVVKACRLHVSDTPLACEKILSNNKKCMAVLDNSAITIPTTLEIFDIVKRNTANVKCVDDSLGQIARMSMAASDGESVSERARGRLEKFLRTVYENASIYLYGASVTGLSGNNCASPYGPSVDMTVIFSELESLDFTSYSHRVPIVKQMRSLKIHVHDLVVRQTALELMSQMVEKVTKTLEGHLDANSSWRADSEALVLAGKQHWQYLQTALVNDIDHPDALNTLRRIDAAKQQLALLEEKFHLTKSEYIVGVEKNLKAAGFERTGCVNKAGEVVFLFNSVEGDKTIPCSLVVERPIFVQTSRLLAGYLGLDKSAKVYAFVALVRSFVSIHGLADELSSYAWTVMAIHCLLRFGFLPNIALNYPNTAGSRTQKVYCCGIDVTMRRYPNITTTCEKKLNDLSMMEMLFIFFHYYVVRADIVGSVFTLRGNGEVFPKTAWHECSSTKLWRLSVEDPFEYAGSESQRDLADKLTIEGQNRIFKLLRQGLYGMVYIIKATALSSEMPALGAVSDLFNKERLAELAATMGKDDEIAFPNSSAQPSTAQTTTASAGSSTDLSREGEPTSSSLDIAHTFGRLSLSLDDTAGSEPKPSARSFNSDKVIDDLGTEFWNEVLNQRSLPEQSREFERK